MTQECRIAELEKELKKEKRKVEELTAKVDSAKEVIEDLTELAIKAIKTSERV